MIEETTEVVIGGGSKYEQVLREAADKVQFSNYIGERWEGVSERALGKLLEDPEQARFHLKLEEGEEIGATVLLDVNPEIKKEAGKLKIPDAVMLVLDSDDSSHVTLRACDFKFNLNRASYRQVHPNTLLEFFGQSSAGREALRQAISGLHDKGKLDGEVIIPEQFPEEQNHPDYIVLDKNERIRLVTGRFISPDTGENREYFKIVEQTNRGIREENVLVLQLTPGEIDEFLEQAPGSELMDRVSDLKVDGSLTLFDQNLIKARAAAAMKAYGLTDVDNLYQLLNGRQAFEVIQEPVVIDVANLPETKRLLGPILRKNMPDMMNVLQETVGLGYQERLEKVIKALDQFGVNEEDTANVVRYFQERLQ